MVLSGPQEGRGENGDRLFGARCSSTDRGRRLRSPPPPPLPTRSSPATLATSRVVVGVALTYTVAQNSKPRPPPSSPPLPTQISNDTFAHIALPTKKTNNVIPASVNVLIGGSMSSCGNYSRQRGEIETTTTLLVPAVRHDRNRPTWDATVPSPRLSDSHIQSIPLPPSPPHPPIEPVPRPPLPRRPRRAAAEARSIRIRTSESNSRCWPPWSASSRWRSSSTST